MAAKDFPIVNLLVGTVIGAGVSLSGVYFNVINVENEKNRFSLEFFEKYQKVMEEGDLNERSLLLQRLRKAHEEPPLTIILAAINLTDREIAEQAELKQAKELEQAAKEAERKLQEAQIAAQQAQEASKKAVAEAARLAAEKEAAQKKEAAAAAAEAARISTDQLRLLSIDLGYDLRGRKTLIP